MNLEFQSETPRLHLLENGITSLFRSILKNFMKQEYLDKNVCYHQLQFHPHYYKSMSNLYFGANVEALICSTVIDKTELENFRIKCLAFYVELSQQINMRFNFDDTILKLLSLFLIMLEIIIFICLISVPNFLMFEV